MQSHFIEKKRSTLSLNSEIDGIMGVGPATREQLFTRFKSIKRIKQVSQKEMIELLGPKKGEKIYKALNP